MKTIRLLLTLAFFAILPRVSLAQSYQYSATTNDVSLSGATTQFTIQRLPPQTATATVKMLAAQVYCSTACNVSQIQNSTPATATAGTIAAVIPAGPAPLSTVWTASNASGGTTIGGLYHLAGGQTITISLPSLQLNNTVNSNYTVAISSITGVANITFFWTEQQ